jgi:DNA-binding response OmpR family regulator
MTTKTTERDRQPRDRNIVTLSSAESTPGPAASGRVWRFDDFVLDTGRYELRRGGDVSKVEPQVFDVMTHLVSNHDRFVTKEELFDTVWGGRFVGEADTRWRGTARPWSGPRTG